MCYTNFVEKHRGLVKWYNNGLQIRSLDRWICNKFNVLVRYRGLVKWYNNGLQIPLLPFLNLSYFNYLISYRGLVKWYNNGLQNHCWEFDSLIPCHLQIQVAGMLLFLLNVGDSVLTRPLFTSRSPLSRLKPFLYWFLLSSRFVI